MLKIVYLYKQQQQQQQKHKKQVITAKVMQLFHTHVNLGGSSDFERGSQTEYVIPYIAQENCLCKVSTIQVTLQKVNTLFISNNN